MIQQRTHLSLAEIVQMEISTEVRNFEREGYRLANSVNWKEFIHRYMKHQSNQNRIDIFGYPTSGDILIHKNSKKIKTYRVQCK